MKAKADSTTELKTRPRNEQRQALGKGDPAAGRCRLGDTSETLVAALFLGDLFRSSGHACYP